MAGFLGSFLRSWRPLAVLALGILALTVFLASGRDAYAGSCPKPCWQELECCCITPCPVKDAQHATKLDEILQNIKEANKLYGVKMPGMDSEKTLKTPVDPAKLAAAGINALEQGVRNVLRGVDQSRGVDVKLPIFTATLAELEKGLKLPDVHADAPGGELALIEDKAKEIDDAYWSKSVVSRGDEEKMRTLRLGNARIEAVDALAYAALKRSEIAESVKSGQAIEKRLGEAMTVSDEVRLNAELRALVTSDWNRVQEMMSYVVTTNASTFVASQENEIVKAPRESSNLAPPNGGGGNSDSYQFASSRSSCEVATRRAVAEHNLLTDVKGLQGHLPQLMETVEEHDARKQHAWDSNNAIVGILSTLYQNPSAAWNKLSAELASLDRTSYMDQGRYTSGRAAADAIVPELLAQKATTRFGKRKTDPNCTKVKQEQNACLPFTLLRAAGSWLQPIVEVNAYYSSADRVYDAYNRYAAIDTSALSIQPKALPPLPNENASKTFNMGGGLGGGEEAEGQQASVEEILAERAEILASNFQLSIDKATILLQYRQEAMKRKFYWDAMRRGDGDDFGPTLRPELKQELIAKYPACFYGQPARNSQTLGSLFTWFDVDPNCPWRTWSGGQFAGERIGHEWLGGVDSAIWSIQNEVADYNKTHKGRAGVTEWAEGAKKFCQGALALAPAAGRTDTIPEIKGYLQSIDAVLRDKDNARRIELQAN